MTLSLNLFELQQYLSGSIHYVAGAQALLLIPVSIVALVRSPRFGLLALGWFVLAFASLYLSLISGARAVYLPLAIVLVLLVVRLIWSGIDWRKLLIYATAFTALVFVFDRVFPNQPMMTALGRKATVSAQTGAASDHGGFSQRLRYWDQALAVALDRPLGAGLGSYQATAHAYQKYPMTWSNSPHNYFLETLATGGWLRLILLLLLLVPPLVRGWIGSAWPWALAVGGMWMTLAFDVTSYYPGFMMLAFLSLGVLYGKMSTGELVAWMPKISPSVGRGLAIATVVAGTAISLWWFVPCSSPTCSVDRYLGIDYKVLPALQKATPEERTTILARTRELYPISSWVVRAEQRYAQTPEEELALAHEFAQRFPYQHPQNYLDWAEAAMELGRPDEALEAIEAGLAIFPAERYPYGEARMTRAGYDEWVIQAHRIVITASREPNRRDDDR